MRDELGGLEKRGYKRIGLKFQVEVETLTDGKVLQLISRDISAGGLGISRLAPEGMEIFTEEELFPDTKVAIRLLLPGCNEEIDLKGTVKWSERSKTGIWKTGIEFDEPQSEIKHHYIREEKTEDRRRSFKRYDRLFQIEIRKEKEKESCIGLSANLSNFGIQVFSDKLISTGTLVETKMRIFGTDRKITAKGTVQWARQAGENTWRMGIRFISPLPMKEFKQI
jgi:hypothetical protein